jgi:hypothetical protein
MAMYLNDYDVETLVSARLEERRAMAARARLLRSDRPGSSLLRLALGRILRCAPAPVPPPAAASPKPHGAGARA